jgi:hypothetical protein
MSDFPVVNRVLELKTEGLDRDAIVKEMLEMASGINERVDKILQAFEELGDDADHSDVYNREQELHSEQ